MNREEYIICAANYYDDDTIHTFKPINIDKGFVVCGHRHHNCISTFVQIVGFPYDENGLKIMRTEIQGFLTNTNKFVDREEASKIAFIANQIEIFKRKLYSEDLY